MSFAAVLRASNRSQPNTVIEIRYRSRNSTTCDPAMITMSCRNHRSPHVYRFGTLHR